MTVDYRASHFTGGFWKAKEDLDRDVTINAVYQQFKESGRIGAFDFNWKEGMPNKPHIYWDSDVVKWMEGAAYILQRENIPELEQKVESLIDRIEEHQWDDGYFNSYYAVIAPDKRFTVRGNHELYCAGHMIEGACAYYEATGRDRWLKCAEKYADLIKKVFMDEHSASFLTPGHEEIELALYRLYKTTGKKKYFELSKYFVDIRGTVSEEENYLENAYFQSHLPAREQREAVGHAVRGVYFYSAMADIARETGDQALADACKALFDDITKRKMSLTGGIGATRFGESFSIPYDLPSDTAYNETCASIGMVMFSHRMFLLDKKRSSIYADVIEREIYNGILSGLSLSGDCFFYENPLEIRVENYTKPYVETKSFTYAPDERPKNFSCSCCPPNLCRFLSSLERYFYAYDEETKEIYINQFADSTYEKDGVNVNVKTDYPLNGKLKITSNVPVHVRIPCWCSFFTADKPYVMKNGYARFEGGEFSLEFDMKPCLITANPAVKELSGKAAVCLGPIVYCAEGIDNKDIFSLSFDVRRISEALIKYNSDFMLNEISLPGFIRTSASGELYAPISSEKFEETEIKLIPYSCFANRGKSDMLVFLGYR